jgi:hypothetical protein
MTEGSHFFNTLIPGIPEGEEEVLYRHLEYPFSVNQIGAIYYDEGYEGSMSRRNNQLKINRKKGVDALVLGRKERLIYESYHQITISNRSNFYYKDGNPSNVAKNNLLVRGHDDQKLIDEAHNNYNTFLQNTMAYMDEKDAKMNERNITPKNYWSLLELPVWLIKVRDAWHGKDQCRPISHKAPTGTKYDRMLEVGKLYGLGYSKSAIAKELGFNSPMLVTYWLDKYNLFKDI